MKRKASCTTSSSTKDIMKTPTAPGIPHGGSSGFTGRGAGRMPSFMFPGNDLCGVSTKASVRECGEESKNVPPRWSAGARTFSRKEFVRHPKFTPSCLAYSESLRGEHKSDDSLRVFDLARCDHLKRAREGDADDLDDLVVFAVALGLAQFCGEEDP